MYNLPPLAPLTELDHINISRIFVDVLYDEDGEPTHFMTPDQQRVWNYKDTIAAHHTDVIDQQRVIDGINSPMCIVDGSDSYIYVSTHHTLTN